jgi:hypothetical protein
VVLAQVAAGVGDLHDELLALDGGGRKGQLVAGAAPLLLVAVGQLGGREAVADGVVDGPRRLRGAHEGAAAVVAARLGVAAVVERAVVLVARLHGALGEVALLRPSARQSIQHADTVRWTEERRVSPARRLAAVPVPRGVAVLGQHRDGQQRGRDGEEETHSDLALRVE